MTSIHEAQDNLRQLATRPNWYDHLPKVEAAMAEQDRIFTIRTNMDWEGDEGGWSVTDPFNPEHCILEENWEDETGLPLPEDMNERDRTILKIAKAFGEQRDNPWDGIRAVYHYMRLLSKLNALP
jgi:hypothetical protein